MDFPDRQAVIRWIILNQFGRRNLSAYDRSVLALKLKPIIAEQAKERKTLGLKSDEGGRTDETLGKLAGVGKDTIHKVETIETIEADGAVCQKSGKVEVNTGKISFSRDVSLTQKLGCRISLNYLQFPEMSDNMKEIKISRPDIFVRTVEEILSRGMDVHVKLSGSQVIIMEESKRKKLTICTGPIGGQ